MTGRGRWHGSLVRRWRAYWRPRIAAADYAGEPLVCPFWLLDPSCPGSIRVTDPWDVDHADLLVDDGELGLANQRPAHTSCNRRAGARVAAARKTERITRVRRWH
jgi:hypothetical protein